MDQIIAEHQILEKKQNDHIRKSFESVDTLIKALNETNLTLQTNPVNPLQALQLLSKKSREISEQVSFNNKEFQRSIVKYEKAVDKKWSKDITIASNPQAFDDKDKILQKTVALHFIRQGKFELGETFIREAQLDISPALQQQFATMYEILEAIKFQELEPALSSLEFQLHRLRYIQFLIDQQHNEALMYAKNNFNYFNNRHLHEIQRLMCALAYINRLQSSPYADLLSTDAWTNIEHIFTRDFCNLLGMSYESPLFISVTVGAQALPTIIKMATIMKEKKNEWSQQDELPVNTFPLMDDMRYHSIFACPVSKEQSTEDNPPMMMPCGHVICKESLTKLIGLNVHIVQVNLTQVKQ
ncbi:8425_t:CDS:2 [Entrophospora sp. SA101]|nr:8425_t:CDS:2 [Entrophospora sp. SA101]